MNALLLFGASYVIFFEVAAAIIYFVMQPRDIQRSMMILSIVFLPIAYMVAKISSALYFDPRPFVSDGVVPLLAHAADNGFPSDHMLLGSAIAAILFVYNRKFGIAAFAAAFAVGAARVFAGVHHWVDILGSAGIVVITMTIVKRYVIGYVERRVYKRFP